MKRSKKHRSKQEWPETSTSRPANQKEHDLAYYIHDRVELMHQVFSVLKPKELKLMAPECVRHINISDLQELCMEELLGISSKRLCAILDGASAPSDTESSSDSEQLETISLDSISSDEEILSQISSKKSKKHKHRSKSKPKKRKSKDNGDDEKDQADRSRRAGLTVLELLELQARARAIRAQLQQEQISAGLTDRPSESVTGNSSDDEVEIKEEAAEVVEISSEDEKPDVQKLEERIAATRKDTTQDISNSKTVTKKVNDLVITVPKTNTSRKIKLKRKTSTKIDEKIPESNKIKNSKITDSVFTIEETSTVDVGSQGSEISTQIASTKSVLDAITTQTSRCNDEKAKVNLMNTGDKNKGKEKKKKRKRNKQSNKDGSDHDEITLQLSDTEKMDLLEDLDGKKSEKCSATEDSSFDSSDVDSVKENDSDEDTNRKSNDSDTLKTDLYKSAVDIENCKEIVGNTDVSTDKKIFSKNKNTNAVQFVRNKSDEDFQDHLETVDKQIVEKDETNDNTIKKNEYVTSQPTDSEERENNVSNKNAIERSCLYDIPKGISDVNIAVVKETIQDVEPKKNQKIIKSIGKCTEINQEVTKESHVTDNELELTISHKTLTSNLELTIVDKVSNELPHSVNREDLKEKSDGEISDRDSSEVEASDFKSDVVCISDDEEKTGKKKKKKDKKAKKGKKSKKKKDFRERGDQNFSNKLNTNIVNHLNTPGKDVILMSEVSKIYDSSLKYDSVMIENVDDSQGKKVIIIPESQELKDIKVNEMGSLKSEFINKDVNLDDDVYEILELSDNSSCYEVEEISISKEPTTEEIEALSAKLDELERDRAIDSYTQGGNEAEELDNVSWKDRYLNSSKVKKVLTTANIMNAMRKKNLELKKKLQDSKKEIERDESVFENVVIASSNFEDGSIEQYKTLGTSNKYVDLVKEVINNTNIETEIENRSEIKITEDKNETNNSAKLEKDTVTKEMKKYETLETSHQYVDPARKVINNTNTETEIENRSEIKITEDKNGTDNSAKVEKDTVTKEMKKEAKQLLKMYKMLLKYNDMSRQKNPSKKRKKNKKSKDNDKSVDSEIASTS